MRPYHPHIGPEIGAHISADAVSVEDGIAEWTKTVEEIVYDALTENMQERCDAHKVIPLQEAGDPKASGAALNALDDVLAPLHPWLGHDWIGQTLGIANALDDDAMHMLFTYASKQVALVGRERGIEKKGSEAKFLSSESIVIKKKEKQMTDDTKPFLDFLRHVLVAAEDTFGAEWATEQVKEIRVTDDPEATAKTLLQCAGYELNENNVRSLLYAVTVSDDIVPTEPQSPAQPTAAKNEPSADARVQQAVHVARTMTGLGDPEIGEMLGVSRSTVANIVSGKAKKMPSKDGQKRLATLMRSRADAIIAAASDLEA